MGTVLLGQVRILWMFSTYIFKPRWGWFFDSYLGRVDGARSDQLDLPESPQHAEIRAGWISSPFTYSYINIFSLVGDAKDLLDNDRQFSSKRLSKFSKDFSFKWMYEWVNQTEILEDWGALRLNWRRICI